MLSIHLIQTSVYFGLPLSQLSMKNLVVFHRLLTRNENINVGMCTLVEQKIVGGYILAFILQCFSLHETSLPQ